MGHGIHEIPLIIFTVLAPASAIAFLLLVIELFRDRASKLGEKDGNRSLIKSMWLVWVVLIVGFVAAGLHLKMPLHAPFALLGIGSSPLTNEVVAGVVFMGLGAVWWLLEFLGKLPPVISRIWAVVAALAGLVFIYFISIAYNIPTVPTWDAFPTQFTLTLIGIVAGPLLAEVVMSLSKLPVDRHRQVSWLAIGGAAAVLFAAGVGMQIVDAGQIRSAFNHAVDLIPLYREILMWSFVLMAIGFIVWGISLFRNWNSPVMFLIGFVILSLGLMAARLLFYSLHMTWGMV